MSSGDVGEAMKERGPVNESRAAAPTDHGLRTILERLEVVFEDCAVRAAAAVRVQVVAYRPLQDEGLEQDLIDHVKAVVRVLLSSLWEGRPASSGDFVLTRGHAARRVRQGVPLSAFLQAIRVGQLTVWEEVLLAAQGDPEAREAALAVAEQLMLLTETCSTQAAEAYLEAERRQFAETDRLRRDLMEDLLARVEVAGAPQQNLMRTIGIVGGRPLVVIRGRPVAPTPDDRALAEVAARTPWGDGATPGLVVARHDEIVGVLPVPASGLPSVVTTLERATRDLAGRGFDLAIGVSLAHSTILDAPDAYTQAATAQSALGSRAGVLALSALTASEYLLLCADRTADRLISPQHRRFVEDDASRGGPLTATLLRYVDNELNAAATARAMHLHVNTVNYRLERLAERSGCNLRRFTELQELLTAVRLLGATEHPQAPPPSAP